MPVTEIPRSEWDAFFDSFSRRHKGWLVTTRLMSTTGGDAVEARGLPLQGITAEPGESNEVEIFLGSEPDHHISHRIEFPTHVRLRQTREGADEALEIEAGSGTLILRFRSAMLPELVDAL